MKQRAFLLVQVIVYIALLLILLFLLLRFNGVVMQCVQTTRSQHAQHMQQLVLHELIRNDVRMASPLLNDWDVECGVFKIWTLSERNRIKTAWVGYHVHHGGIRRAEGTYLPATHRWASIFSVHFDYLVERVQFVVHKDTRSNTPASMIAAVDIEIAWRNQGASHLFVALENTII